MFNTHEHNAVMYKALFSQGPHPDFADKLSLFGQFVGSWDVDVIDHLPDGSAQVVKGEAHFGWALEGRAILDVWIIPRRELRSEMPGIGDYGATLRFYDPDIDAWLSTWIGPAKHFVFPFIGRFINSEIILEGNFGGEIVLEGVHKEGVLTRLIFSDITTESFKWRALQSNDGWVTHLLYQEMVARRAVNVYSE